MKATANSPRPTLRQFLTCCRVEFRFLADHGFRELPGGEASHPEPFRFHMAGESLEFCVRGVAHGERSSVSLRDHDGREFWVGRLVPASSTASRLSRRRHPDGQRADIMAAAAALREFPAILASASFAEARDA